MALFHYRVLGSNRLIDLETFLYGFLTPILSYMLEERLHIDPSQTQRYTTALLTIHGFVGLIAAPAIGYLAEKTTSQKKPLLISLAGCLVGTLMIALASSGMIHFSLTGRVSLKLTIISSLGSISWSRSARRRRCWHLGSRICFVG